LSNADWRSRFLTANGSFSSGRLPDLTPLVSSFGKVPLLVRVETNTIE